MRFGAFSFFIQNLPTQVVTSYLARYYNWKLAIRSGSSLNLFVSYYGGSIPKKYKQLLTLVPDLCLNQSAHITNSRFILAAPLEGLIENSDISSLFIDQLLLKESTYHNRNVKFQIRDQIWSSGDPKIVGILNITPDSFFDGGSYTSTCDFELLAQKMIDEGADLIDIGGESTRPGSQPVDSREEISRIQQAVTSIRKRFNIPISIDTTKVVVAEAMLRLGADMINDVSGLSEGDKMIETILKYKASYCLTHTKGPPKTMQNNPVYEDLIAEIYIFFKHTIEKFTELGVPSDKIMIDPGIGFGKTLEQNIDILRLMPAFTNLSTPIMLGTSNKSFIGKILDADLKNRLAGTIATQVLGFTNGASFFRVHNIKEIKDAISITSRYFSD